MKVVKSWNKISDELKAEIPVLQKGETKTFRMLNGQVNNEPDETERKKQGLTLYPRTQLPMRDRIYDPYAKQYVDIIVADGWTGDEPNRPLFFLPEAGDFRFNGRFSLSAGNIADEEKFQFLWLTNYRKGNVHRDESVQALIELIDAEKESTSKGASVDTMFEAISKVKALSELEVRKIAASLGWSSTSKHKVLVADLKAYAKDHPEKFMEIADAPITAIKADIQQALAQDIIKFDQTTGKVTMGKTNLLATFDAKQQGFVLIDELAAWILSANNGEDVLISIRKQLKK